MSQLIFNPQTGLVAPETEDIRNSVAAEWVEAFAREGEVDLDTSPSTPAGQLIDAEVAEIEAKNTALVYLANQFNPRASDGVWQDALGYIYFLERKLDEPTVVTCQVTGLRGTTIPYGALAKSSDGYDLICSRSVVIGDDGAGETTFRVAMSGPIDIVPRSVNQIVTVVPGWDTINNAHAGVRGRDLETRSEFEARRAASVAANAHGSVGAIYGTIANIRGVLDVEILENIGPTPVTKYGVVVPAHGITICVYGGEDAEIAEAIYRKKDNGCDTGGNLDVHYVDTETPGNPSYTYKILRPAPTTFRIRVTLGTDTALTESQRSGLRNNLLDDFYGNNATTGNPRVGMASKVYASRFYCPALSSDGVKSVHKVEIALGDSVTPAFTDVIEIRGDQEPTLVVQHVELVGS